MLSSYRFALLLSLLGQLALRCTAAATGSTTACNNSPSLCSRNYNNVTHLGAHDSPFLRDSSTDFSTSGNQFYNSTVQLEAGVRLLTAQVFSVNGSSGQEWHLCHTSCDLIDAGTLENWLSEIKAWMDSNPNDVVTVLLVNSEATASDLDGQFSGSGIKPYAYTPPSITTAPSEWPTLQTLISNNTRLLTFIASLPAAPASGQEYLMQEFNFVVENNFEVTSAANFSCTPQRPSTVSGNAAAAASAHLMPLMNHFLDSSESFGIEVPNATYASTTNAQSGGVGNLGSAVGQCESLYAHAPTFILVDFFNVGPAIATVDSLNGVTNPVGRTQVSTAELSPSSSAAPTVRGGSLVALSLAILAATVLA